MRRIIFQWAMTAGLMGIFNPLTGQAKPASAAAAPPISAQADSMERLATRYKLSASWAPPPGKTQAQYDENEKYRAWKRKWSETLKKAAAERRAYLASGKQDAKREAQYDQQYLKLQATMTGEAKKFDRIAAEMKQAPRPAASTEGKQ